MEQLREGRMTPEEVERRMEFIIEHQAQFAVRLDRLLEANQRLSDSHALLWQAETNLNGALGRLTEVVQDLAQAQRRTDEQLRTTIEQLRATDQQLRRTDEQLKETDDRLNALITVVDRHVAGHNPGSPA